jgi:hypothetical protein
VHSGFVPSKNDTAYRNLSKGWKKVVGKIRAISSEQSTKGNPRFSKPGKASPLRSDLKIDNCN